MLGADILPSVELGENEHPARGKGSGAFINLPKRMFARNAAMCVPGDQSLVKLLSFPGKLSDDPDPQIKALMGIQDRAYRVSYKTVGRVHGRPSETRLLALALPERTIESALAVFPSGTPAPVSVEMEGFAAVTAFMHGHEGDISNSAVALVHHESRSTFLFFFCRGQLVLIRKLDFGCCDLLDKVQQSLGVDSVTAENIVRDGSFDISQLVKDVAEPFIKQLVMSKHYVERRENCDVSRVFVAEDLSGNWLKDLHSELAVEMKSWNPFDGLNALPAAMAGEYLKSPSRFAAAVGAALGAFESSSA